MLMVLVMIPIGYAIKNCDSIVTPKDVPCMIVSTWAYTDCAATQAVIYNSTPVLIETKNFTGYGTSGRCNFTWNYSASDTYVWNVTNGDTGKITVEYEDDNMASLGIILFVMALTAVMFILPYKVEFTKHQISNLILKRCCILFGMFLLSLDTVIVVTIADTFGLGVNRELFRYLWIINWSIYLMMLYLVLSTVRDSLELWKQLSKEKRMGLIG